jgi:peptidoglycan/LPS O-acetylase OafA/YrhL
VNTKKIRNIVIILGVMIALLPWFYYFALNQYHGVFFSMITTSLAVLSFIAAALIQAYENKKKGESILFPVLVVCGFVALLIYVLFFL